MRPYENLIFIKQNFILKVSTYLMVFVSLGLLSLGLLSGNKHAKLALGLMATLSGSASNLMARALYENELHQNDNDDLITTQRNNSNFMRLADPIANPFFADQEQDEETIEVIPENINYNTEFLDLEPHFAILGPTGSGKSVFVRYLLDVLLDNHTIRLDPHKTPDPNKEKINIEELKTKLNKPGNIDITLGEGRNFDQIGEALNMALELMDFRYNNGGESAKFPVVNFLIEEGPAIAQAEESSELWKEIQPILLREARKVNIRLIMVTQGQQVESLGIKGQSDLKDCYCFIRIGSFALKEAIKLKNDNLIKALQDDYDQSIKDHKKSGSKAKFKGTCWLINGQRLPYINLSFLLSEDKNSTFVPLVPTNIKHDLKGSISKMEQSIREIYRPKFLDRGSFAYYLSLRKIGKLHSDSVKMLINSNAKYTETNNYIKRCLDELNMKITDDFSQLED